LGFNDLRLDIPYRTRLSWNHVVETSRIAHL
jgi:hypothetical protein